MSQFLPILKCRHSKVFLTPYVIPHKQSVVYRRTLSPCVETVVYLQRPVGSHVEFSNQSGSFSDWKILALIQQGACKSSVEIPLLSHMDPSLQYVGRVQASLRGLWLLFKRQTIFKPTCFFSKLYSKTLRLFQNPLFNTSLPHPEIPQRGE